MSLLDFNLGKLASVLVSASRLLAMPVLSLSIVLAPADIAQARLSTSSNNHVNNQEAQRLYQALVAELYHHLGDEQRAVQHYTKLVSISSDPAILKRATMLAATTGQIRQGLVTAKIWVDNSPENLEAGQYLALLYLRNSDYPSAAKQLHKIRQQVDLKAAAKAKPETDEKNHNPKSNHSEGLNFIGTLLAVESHHAKALNAYNEYLQQHASAPLDQQQRLISATLAMNAKEYSSVVKNLSRLETLDRQYQIKAASMKAKALKKLGQPQKALKVLKLIKDYAETPDSDRLELVRLMVLNQKKPEALVILQALINKHPFNMELLKSLIALQIDQKQFNNAKVNIKKLEKSADFKSDADYLSGEVYEAQAKPLLALASYQKVTGGKFQRNAQSKAIRLTRKHHGLSALTGLLESYVETETSPKQKARWLKSLADLKFDNHQHQQAFKLYSKAIELAPENAIYRYQRGLLNEKMGQLELAEKDFSFILKSDEKQQQDADALNALGYMLIVHTNRVDEARDYIKQAYQIKPDDPAILDSMGWLYFKTGDYTRAIAYLRQAYSQIQTPEVASHLISALVESGQQQEAIDIYTVMHKKYPNDKNLLNVRHYLPEI